MSGLKLKNLILIFGSEEFLKDQKKNSLLKELGALGSVNFNAFNDENTDLYEINRLSLTAPFFEGHRTILVTDSGLFSKKNKYDNDLALKFLNSIPEYTFLIFCEKDVQASNPLYKLVKKKGDIFEYGSCDSLRGREKDTQRYKIRNWALSKIRAEKKDIDSGTLYGLLEITGYDMQNLSTELEKLISFTLNRPPGYKINQADTEAICSRTLSDRVFSMLDLKLKGDISSALEALEEMISLKVPLMKILVLMERQYLQALSVRALVDEKSADEEICEKMQIKDWQLRKLKKQISGISYDEFLRRLEECVTMDYKIKTGDISDRLAVEILMVS